MSGLTAAAAAALGVRPDPPQPPRLVWVDVEDSPRMIDVLDPTDGSPNGWYAAVDPGLGLTDRMADKFRAVCDAVDDNLCEAARCVASRYERDGKPVGVGIGWVLAGEADERTEWAGMTLVQYGRAVIAVCLDCSPRARFAPLWQA